MTFREEIIGDCRLILGDCLSLMQGVGPVDHVISDPPYEDELHKAVGRIRRKDGRSMISDLGFEGINASRASVAKACIESASGWVILFTLAEGVRAWRDELQSVGAKWDTTCFWVKPDASPRFNGQGPARGAECFVTCWAGGGYRRWNAGGKRGIYTHCVNTGRHGAHPTEKPVPLMSEILTDFTCPGDTILDPFMGSGTTGVACVKTGRKFIGIELDPDYFEIACQRISDAYAQPDFFVGQASAKLRQEPLL
ncbi:MAG: site-specific DNA-methyltransferase [Pseudomonadota bacterium]|nr:site-specific DNA-methyltransferase [Pseudomonadota bacterium]